MTNSDIQNMLQMTQTELLTSVATFYKAPLTLEKALKIFVMEYGFVPEIVDAKNIVNQEFIDSQNYPECVTTEALTYMKELQDSGVTNMFQAVPYIQQALGYSAKDAKTLLMTYMTDYTKIYYPENLL